MNDALSTNLLMLSEQLANRRLSALDVVDSFIQRIGAIDPSLNAFRELDIERARDQAKVSASRKRRLSPLDGIPFAVKDNIDVQGLVTRSGLGRRSERPAMKHADIVHRLCSTGAIVLGHTNMHEGALGATNDNPHYGKTHNPWRQGHTPGGSSGGSAAAVAAGLCPFALGTDTMGSVRLPAAYCGITGMKPSRGLFDNRGIEPLCEALDQVGAITSTVADLQLLFTALTKIEPPFSPIDLRELRIARLGHGDDVDFSDEVRSAFDDVMRSFEQEGVEVSNVAVSGFDPGRLRRAGLLLAEAEAADHYRDDRRDYPDAFSTAFTALLDYGAGADHDRLQRAEMTIKSMAMAFDALFSSIDLLLTPTTPQAAFSFDDPTPSNQADLTAFANVAGMPALSLPMALDKQGLPLGLQVIAARGADGTVLAASAMLETMLAFERPELPHGAMA